MKKGILAVFMVLAMVCVANAWTLNWDDQTGVDGYSVFWKPLADTTFQEVSGIANSEFDLDGLGLNPGVRYEFYIVAVSNGSISAESDHIRWTMPADPVTIELPEYNIQLQLMKPIN